LVRTGIKRNRKKVEQKETQKRLKVASFRTVDVRKSEEGHFSDRSEGE